MLKNPESPSESEIKLRKTQCLSKYSEILLGCNKMKIENAVRTMLLKNPYL